MIQLILIAWCWLDNGPNWSDSSSSLSVSSLASRAAAAAAAVGEMPGGGPFMYAGGRKLEEGVEDWNWLLLSPGSVGVALVRIPGNGDPTIRFDKGEGDVAFRPEARSAATAVLLSNGFSPTIGPECFGCWSCGLTSILAKGIPLVTVVMRVFFSEISSLSFLTCFSLLPRFWKNPESINFTLLKVSFARKQKFMKELTASSYSTLMVVSLNRCVRAYMS